MAKSTIEVSELESEILELRKKLSETEVSKTKSLDPKCPLLNKKVKIELIPNKNNTFHKNVNQSTLLTGASNSFKVPVDKSGNLVDPLTREERIWLEKELGLNLSIHTRNTELDPKANFWSTKSAKVTLNKASENLASASLILDLSNPYDFIKYKIALISPRVANTWSQRNDSGDYEFVIVDGDVEMEESLKIVEMTDKVLEHLFSIKNNKKKLFDLIRLYGAAHLDKAIKYSNSAEMMYLELRKLMDSNKAVKGLYEIIKQGSDVVSNKVFLQDGVTCGILEKRGAEYTLKGGGLIGYDEDSAVAFLLKPVNQSIKLQIEASITSFYENNQ